MHARAASRRRKPVEESFQAGVQQVAHVGARLDVTLGVAVAHRFQHALDSNGRMVASGRACQSAQALSKVRRASSALTL